MFLLHINLGTRYSVLVSLGNSANGGEICHQMIS